MIDRSKKEIKNIEVSLGLLVGYLIAASINMMVFDKRWEEAFFADEKLLFGFAGIALSVFLILRVKKKRKTN